MHVQWAAGAGLELPGAARRYFAGDGWISASKLDGAPPPARQARGRAGAG